VDDVEVRGRCRAIAEFGHAMPPMIPRAAVSRQTAAKAFIAKVSIGLRATSGLLAGAGRVG
jgi:hypothetical protein